MKKSVIHKRRAVLNGKVSHPALREAPPSAASELGRVNKISMPEAVEHCRARGGVGGIVDVSEPSLREAPAVGRRHHTASSERSEPAALLFT